MCGCAKTKTNTKVNKQVKFVLIDGSGEKHVYDNDRDAYQARAKLGGTVKSETR